MQDIDGRDLKMSKYAGKVVLVCNVASQCGFTPQVWPSPPCMPAPRFIRTPARTIRTRHYSAVKRRVQLKLLRPVVRVSPVSLPPCLSGSPFRPCATCITMLVEPDALHRLRLLRWFWIACYLYSTHHGCS